MLAFIQEQHANRVVFGCGARHRTADEVLGLGMQRVLIISEHIVSSHADSIADALGEHAVLRWNEIAQHVPSELAERARLAATEASVDGIVCIGGGSSTGLAKAIALSHRIPIVAVPTTYAGSEQTSIYGITGARHKATGRDPIVVPRVVVYDPELTVGLPPRVTGPSSFNALAHSVEALYATGANPVTTALAIEGIRSINLHLPAAISTPSDLDARSGLLYGAYLSGIALGTTSAGLHHKICHVLGGTFNLVHADAHSVVLPHVTAFNLVVMGDVAGRVATALDSDIDDLGGALWDLAGRSNVPRSLRELGVKLDQLDEIVQRVMAELPTNPRPVQRNDIVAMVGAAFNGNRPERVPLQPH